MAWPAWPKTNEKMLASYVLPQLAARLKLAQSRDDVLARPNGRLELLSLIYDALIAKDLRYAREEYDPESEHQRIRDTELLLEGAGDATCLDLALLFAGVCLGNELLPLVVVVRGHAFVAVSLTRDRRNADEMARRDEDDGDGAWVTEGLLTDGDRLKHLIEREDWIAIECTGFARSESIPETVPEGKSRQKGCLSFEDACKAGAEQLSEPNRPFEFAIDAAVLQDLRKNRPFDPPSRSLENLQPDLRLRLARVFDSHRLFGGRDDELARLNRFLEKNSCGYTFVTGVSGSGKSALIANWLRHLLGRADIRVAYHFINRQHQLAREEDLLRTLCQQLLRARGISGALPGPIVELQSLYIELASEPYFNGKLVIVIDGLDEADGWHPGSMLFPAQLPPAVYIVFSAREIAGRDWVADLGLNATGIETLRLDRLDKDGVAALLRAAGAPASVRADDKQFVSALYGRSEGDPFYLHFLVQDILDNQITSIADVQSRPKGLAGYLDRWWDELQGGVNDPAVQDLLGYLLVAQGGLTRNDLIGISAEDRLNGFNVEAAIKKLYRFIVGTQESGYKLCHPRFRDHLTESKIPREDQDPYREALLGWCAKWETAKHRYALLYYASDLLEAHKTAEGEQAPAHLRTLVALLGNQAFQEKALGATGDLPALQQDFHAAIRCAAADPSDKTLPLLAEIALALGTMRQRWLKPEAVFALAKDGKLATARRRLELLPVDDRWLRVGLLVIAWITAQRSEAQAREFIAESGALLHEIYDGTLALMRDRVFFAAGHAASAPELALPYAPGKLPDYALPPGMLRDLVDRIGGSREMNISGLKPLADFEKYGDEAVSYIAEDDSPKLVRAVIETPAAAIPFLREYVHIHAANPYREYRNRSLWGILGAVLSDPDDQRALEIATEIAGGAFSASSVDYREAFSLALLALRARYGDPDAAEKLAQRRSEATEAGEQLDPIRTNSDSWGYHCRRHAALAEALAVGRDNAGDAGLLLDKAAKIPWGYAGFQAPASLRLAEANLLCRPDRTDAVKDALEAARRSAYKVQDAMFCAVTVARVNGTIEHWWRGPIADIAAVIERFVQDPMTAEFSPVYQVGDQYVPRGEGPEIIKIPHAVLAASTLRDIAQTVFGRSAGTFERLNSHIPDPLSPLAPGTEVFVPDPDFVPLLSARFAAEALAQRNVLGADCAGLIRRLVPLVASNATALDTLLARLALAAGPPAAMVDELEKLAPTEWMSEPVPDRRLPA